MQGYRWLGMLLRHLSVSDQLLASSRDQWS